MKGDFAVKISKALNNVIKFVMRNSYHGAYRQGIVRGVPPSPSVSAQTPYVLGGGAPVDQAGVPVGYYPT